MADQENDRNNGFLDSMAQLNPDILKKFWEAGTMTADKAHEYLYGEPIPGEGTSLRRKLWMENFGHLQKNVFDYAIKNLTDPTFGGTVKEGAKVLGVKPEDFASADQVKLEPQSVNAPNTLVPPTFDIDQLQSNKPHTPWMPGSAGIPRGLTEEQIYGEVPGDKLVSPGAIGPLDTGKHIPLQPQDIMSRGERTLELDPKKVFNENAPMNQLQRAETRSALERNTKWPSGRGMTGAAGKEHLGQAYIQALETYGPQDPRTITAGVAAGVYKSTAQAGSVEEELGKGRAQNAQASAQLKQEELAHAGQMWDLKAQDILSRIQARSRNTAAMEGVNQALIDLRQSQTAINQMKMAGEMPEQVQAAINEQHRDTQRRFVRSYLATWDPKDIMTPEGQDVIAQDLMNILGLEGGAMKSQVGGFRKLGQSMGITEKPTVGHAAPGVATPRELPGGAPALPKQKTAKEDLDEITKQVMKDLETNDLSKFEGKTLNNGKYIIKGGKVEKVK